MATLTSSEPRPEPLFQVGQRVWIDWPTKAEHGSYGDVERVAPWSGPISYYDTYEYTILFYWPDGSSFGRTTVGERMLSDRNPL